MRNCVKGVLFILLVLNINGTMTTKASEIHTEYAQAKPNYVDVSYEGKQSALAAYNINGFNYCKLRDVCQILDICLEWDNTLNAVWIDSSRPYNNDSTIDFAPKMDIVDTVVTDQVIFINGYDDYVKGCNVGDFNYFKIRDIIELIEKSCDKRGDNTTYPYFTLTWDTAAQNMLLVKNIESAVEEITNLSDSTEELLLNNIKLTEEEFFDEIITLVNAERARLGIAPLQKDEKLSELANLRAEEMCRTRIYSHNLPESGTLAEFSISNYNKNILGENLTTGYINPSPERIYMAWYNSEAHKNNMLNSRYSYIGVGMCYDEYGTATVVQLFKL